MTGSKRQCRMTARSSSRCESCASAGERVPRNAVDVRGRRCEDCKRSGPSYGVPPDRKRRWCDGCAKVILVFSSATEPAWPHER
jgi:hypothetical protein